MTTDAIIGSAGDIPVLYSFRRCPYAMRARMALLASGAPYEHREVVLRDKPAAMLRASPKATVPVLVLADGAVIDESLDIMHWALTQHDPDRWLLRANASLVATFDGAFKYHLDRYKYAVRYDADPFTHRAACLVMLEDLDARLGRSDYLDGAARGFSDIAIFPFVRQFGGTDPLWFDAHAPRRVAEWLRGLIAAPLFEQAMVKFAAWSEGRD